MEIRIYVANLAEYVGGRLVGEWIELPCSDLSEVLDRISNNGQDELAIHDFEAPFEIGEYDNIEKLNDTAEQLQDIGEDESVVTAILKNFSTVEEALEIITNGDYRVYHCDTMADVAAEVVEECGYLRDVPEQIACYFDYQAFGRDLEIEGTFIRCNGFYVEVIA